MNDSCLCWKFRIRDALHSKAKANGIHFEEGAMSDVQWGDRPELGGGIARTNGRACTTSATGTITIRAAWCATWTCPATGTSAALRRT